MGVGRGGDGGGGGHRRHGHILEGQEHGKAGVLKTPGQWSENQYPALKAGKIPKYVKQPCQRRSGGTVERAGDPELSP